MTLQPIYVEVVKIDGNIKFASVGEGNPERFGKLDLVFFDKIEGEPVARLMMDPYSAQQISDEISTAAKQMLIKMGVIKQGV